jgi:hypothetical protein
MWKEIFHPLWEFGAKLLQEDGNFCLEKGKIREGKSVGSWLGASVGWV